jgi:hypothetical protein
MLHGSGRAMAKAVACLASRRLRFAPGSFHVGFVLEKVALGQDFPFSSPCQYHFTLALSIHIYHLKITNMPVGGRSSET